MKIYKASKQGPCKGVIAAINKVNKVINDDTIPRPIYMLGSVVHNDHIIEAYRKKGLIILDGKTRLDLLDQIDSGSVIITAHGVADCVIKKAQDKGLYIIDATCIDVSKTKNLIKRKIEEGYEIIYLGVYGHPEAEGVIAESQRIHFISKADDYNLNLSGKVILTNQTTLSYDFVIKQYQKLKIVIPQLEIANEICNATSSRQSCLINEANGFDLCLVIGDHKSNNTNMLKKVCEENTSTKAIIIENVESLNKINFENINNIIVTSGASTPACIVDEIIYNLENNKKPFKSILKYDDFIKII